MESAPYGRLPLPSERVGSIDALVEQVDPTVGDIYRTRADTGYLPIDKTRHDSSVPQHVAGVKVAMNECAVVVQDRTVEDLDPSPVSGCHGRR